LNEKERRVPRKNPNRRTLINVMEAGDGKKRLVIRGRSCFGVKKVGHKLRGIEGKEKEKRKCAAKTAAKDSV